MNRENYRKERRDSKTSGSTAYPKAKADGDKSMPSKREMSEGVYGIVPRDPRDTVRAKLPKSQFPAMKIHIPRLQRLHSEATDIRRNLGLRRNLSVGAAVENDSTQGNGRDTYVALENV